MLITRKLTKDKRPVVDFGLLNTRILRQNISIPLMSDVLSILGNSGCGVLSCLDLRDAYHSIPLTDAYHSISLTDKSKEYCCILILGALFPDMRSCQWELHMHHKSGWTVSMIIGSLDDKSKYITIMDDF